MMYRFEFNRSVILAIIIVSCVSCSSKDELNIEDYPYKIKSYYNKENQKPQAIFYYTAKPNDDSEGVLKMLYDDGVILSISPVKNDKRHGIIEIYYKTGELEMKVEYNYGIENGIFENYHKSGKIAIIGEYKNGKEQGIWSYYDENGNIRFKEEYVEGKIVDM